MNRFRIPVSMSVGALMFGCQAGVAPGGAAIARSSEPQTEEQPVEPAEELNETQAACIDAVLAERDAALEAMYAEIHSETGGTGHPWEVSHPIHLWDIFACTLGDLPATLAVIEEQKREWDDVTVVNIAAYLNRDQPSAVARICGEIGEDYCARLFGDTGMDYEECMEARLPEWQNDCRTDQFGRYLY